MESEMVTKLKEHLTSISEEEFKKEWKEITEDDLDEEIPIETVGTDIIEYCKQYEGTDKYNVAMEAIAYGYQLALKYDL